MVFSDNAGNVFLGDCIWANHRVDYSTIKFLDAHPHTGLSSELSSLTSTAGLLTKFVRTQASIDANTTRVPLISFGATGDINGRYMFTSTSFFGDNSTGNSVAVLFYNNSGNVLVQNEALNITTGGNFTINQLGGLGNQTNGTTGGGTSGNNWSSNFATASNPVWAGVADNSSLGLFGYQYNLATNSIVGYIFFYAGLLADINTNFNYYSASNITRSFMMVSAFRSTGPATGTVVSSGHYISNTFKTPLQTGDAQYPIVCSDGQTPTSQWATDFYVFDNNATIGNPAIGRVRNLLLATGSYTIGKPVRIQGTTRPAGFNRWLPVGTFAGKTVLMRCYSSVEI